MDHSRTVQPRLVGVRVAAAVLSVALLAPADGSCERDKLLASDAAASGALGATETGGRAVAIDEGVLVISAYRDAAETGAVYVFRPDGALWSEETKLVSTDGDPGDRFGASVDVEADVVVVGAPRDDDAGTDAGAIYIYTYNGVDWVEDKLTGGDSVAGDLFGSSVSLDGAVIAVGAPGDDDDGSQSGSVYLFRFNGANWLPEMPVPKLTADGASASAHDRYGSSVAVDGVALIVGAPGDSSAYAYRYDGANWIDEERLVASNGSTGDDFGESVDLDDDIAVVGARAQSTTGSAYAFRYDSADWLEEAELLPMDAAAGDFIGDSVAILGDTVLVGSPLDDDAGPGSGSAYVFTFGGAVWSETDKLAAVDASALDGFGSSVALATDLALIASPRDADFGPNTGAATVWTLSGEDCNGTGFCDDSDIALGLSIDCQPNGVPDECDIADGTSLDVDPTDGIPDECTDCNNNDIPDDLEIAGDSCLDFNLNNRLDACEGFAGAATWAQPAGGSFRDASNWSPLTPTAANAAMFDTVVAGPLTFDVQTCLGDDPFQTDRLIVAGGDVVFELNGATYEQLAGLETSVLVDGGALGFSGGTIAGGSGAVGSTSILPGVLTSTGMAAALVFAENFCVGCQDEGELFIQDGALVFCRDGDVGGASGTGTVTLFGAGSAWEVPFIMRINRGVVRLGDQTFLRAGFAFPPIPGVIVPGIFVFEDGAIEGLGTIEGNVVNFGRVSVGDDFAGVLTVQGNYLQAGQVQGLGSTSGPLWLDVAGTMPGIDQDQLIVSQQADLSGGLIIESPPGFDAASLTNFSVVSANEIIDPPDIGLFPGLAGGKFMRFETTAFGPAAGVTVTVDTFLNLLGFDSPQPTTIGGQPTGLVSADFNGDLFDDLAVSVPSGVSNGSVFVLLSDGTGGFQAPVQFTVGVDPRGIAAGTLDAGANVDLVVANAGDNTVSVLLGNGTGGFSPAGLPVAVGNNPQDVAFGHFTGGTVALDLAVALTGDDAVAILEWNAGMGTVVPPFPPLAVGFQPLRIDPESVDDSKDVDDDLLVATFGGNAVSLLTNMGGNTFTRTDLPVGAGPVDVMGSDLNGDGYAEIVTANIGNGTVSVLLNQAAAAPGQFLPAVNLPVGEFPRSLTLVDIEQDTDVDIAVVADSDQPGMEGTPIVQIVRNDTFQAGGGQLVLAAADELQSGDGPLLVTNGDVDNDGAADLITINDGIGMATAPGGNAGGVAAARTGPPAPSVNVNLNLLVRKLEPPCPEDVSGDGEVGVDDLVLVILAWNTSDTAADVDGSGSVGVDDLVAVVKDWGDMSMKRLILIAAAVLAAAATGAQAETRTWNTASGSWHVPENWSPVGVPANGDDVMIPALPGAVMVTYSTGAVSLGSLVNDEVLTITGGTLTLDGPAESRNRLRLLGGVLNGTGDLVVSGPTPALEWTGGTMSGTGITVIDIDAVAELTGSGGRTLDRTLENAGTIDWIDGDFSGTGMLVTLPGGELNDLVAANVTWSSGAMLLNEGIYSKLGAGTTTHAMQFVNDGQVFIDAGVLDLNSGATHTGPFVLATGTSLELSGSMTFSVGAVLAGSGHLILNGGPYTFNDSVDLRGGGSITQTAGQLATFNAEVITHDLSLDGGTTAFNDTVLVTSGEVLISNGDAAFNVDQTWANVTMTGSFSGIGDITITESLTWVNGFMMGTGHTIIAADAVVAMSSGAFLNQRVLENYGTFSKTGSSDFLFGNNNNASQHGTFNNMPGGTLHLTGDGDIVCAPHGNGQSQGFFTNTGTIIRDGTGQTDISLNSFDNSGSIDLQEGTLAIQATATNSGDITAAPGTTLRLDGSFVHQEGATLTTLGYLVLNGGPSTFTGTVMAFASLTISGGTSTFNAGSLQTVVDLAITGGNGITFNGIVAPATLSGFGTATNVTFNDWLDYTGPISIHGFVTFSQDQFFSRVTMTNGSLTSTADITIMESLEWTNGTMAGLGHTIIEEGAVVMMTTGSVKDRRVIDNYGTFNKTGSSDFFFGNNNIASHHGTFNNMPQATLHVTGDGDIVRPTGGTGQAQGYFNNMGTIIRDGTGQTDISLNSFDNSESIDLQEGTLAIQATATNSGDITTAPDTTLRLDGSFVHQAGATLTTLGNLVLNGGPSTFTGTVMAFASLTISGGTSTFNAGSLQTVADLVITGGNGITFNGIVAPATLSGFGTATNVTFNDWLNYTGPISTQGFVTFSQDQVFSRVTMTNGILTSTADITITESLEWTNGTMAGLGHTIIEEGAVVMMTTGSVKDRRVIDNYGTFNKTGSSDFLFGNNNIASQHGTFNNMPGGTLHVTGDGDIVRPTGGTGQAQGFFNNMGTIIRDGTGQTDIVLNSFDTSGLTEVQEGTLSLNSAAESHSGDITVLDLAVLLDQTLISTSGTVTCDGMIQSSQVRIDSGELIGSGTIDANLVMAGGRLSPGGPIGTLTVTGTYTQQAAATLLVEASGLAPGSGFDVLAVDGNVTLGGTLQFSALPPYLPDVGNLFEIITTLGTVTGKFPNVDCPEAFQVNTFSAAVEVEIIGTPCPDCVGDVDGSGDVGIDDLVQIVVLWGTSDPLADIDGSGTVDVNDLVAVITAWGVCD